MVRIELNDEILRYHKDYILNDSGILENLNKLYEKNISKAKKDFVKYLIGQVEKLNTVDYSDSIFLMTPKEMKEQLDYIRDNYKEAYEDCLKKKSRFSKYILSALDYDQFTKNMPEDKGTKELREDESQKKWGAYAFLMKLDLSVCPYCNRTFINTVYMTPKSGKARADLDHFLPKAKYPYFSMSIYNLVPSCSVCNSRFKGQKEFKYTKNLNPYENLEINDLLTFGYSPDNYLECIGLDDNKLSVKLNFNKSEHKEKAIHAKRLEDNCKVFHIEEVYQNHTDVVRDILLKHHIFSDDYKKQIMNSYKDLFSSEEEMDRLLYGYIKEDDIKNTMLGKLQFDINKEANALD